MLKPQKRKLEEKNQQEISDFNADMLFRHEDDRLCRLGSEPCGTALHSESQITVCGYSAGAE